MLSFACISPHPPLLLPTVGSEEDRLKVKNTLEALKILRTKFWEKAPDNILISSPHADWGFNVPLFFLAEGFKGSIKTYLTGAERPAFYFDLGRNIYKSEINNQQSKIGNRRGGDLS